MCQPTYKQWLKVSLTMLMTYANHCSELFLKKWVKCLRVTSFMYFHQPQLPSFWIVLFWYMQFRQMWSQYEGVRVFLLCVCFVMLWNKMFCLAIWVYVFKIIFLMSLYNTTEALPPRAPGLALVSGFVLFCSWTLRLSTAKK